MVLLVPLVLLVLAVTLVNSKITVLDSKTLAPLQSFPSFNIFDSAESFNREKFKALIVPLNFKPNCKPIKLQQQQQLFEVNNTAFYKTMLLLLVDWKGVRRLGCLNQGQVESSIQQNMKNVKMPWKLLFFGRVYENGYDVSSPYIYQGNLSDSINLGPKAGAYLLQKGMDQVIIATVEREPGPWNLLITGTTYLLVHWTIFCLNLIGLLMGVGRLIIIMREIKRRNIVLNIPKSWSIVESFLLLRINGICYFIAALFGFYERATLPWLHVIQFGYWILTTWSYCGMQLAWSWIAYKVQRERSILLIKYGSIIGMLLPPIFLAIITYGIIAPLAYDIMWLGLYLFFGGLQGYLLIHSVLFVILAIKFLVFAADLKISIKALFYLRMVTFLSLGILASRIILTTGCALFLSPLVGNPGFYLFFIGFLPMAGFVLQGLVYLLPLGVEYESNNLPPSPSSYIREDDDGHESSADAESAGWITTTFTTSPYVAANIEPHH